MVTVESGNGEVVISRQPCLLPTCKACPILIPFRRTPQVIFLSSHIHFVVSVASPVELSLLRLTRSVSDGARPYSFQKTSHEKSLVLYPTAVNGFGRTQRYSLGHQCACVCAKWVTCYQGNDGELIYTLLKIKHPPSASSVAIKLRRSTSRSGITGMGHIPRYRVIVYIWAYFYLLLIPRRTQGGRVSGYLARGCYRVHAETKDFGRIHLENSIYHAHVWLYIFRDLWIPCGKPRWAVHCSYIVVSHIDQLDRLLNQSSLHDPL